MSLILKILFAIALAYAVAMLALYFGQRKLMYHPDPTRTLPEALGLERVSERTMTTPDGQKIVTWRGDAQPGQPTLLYFHGNGAALSARAGRVQALQEAGLGIALMSYRGYSGSTGHPSEEANTRDARQLYDEVRAQGVSASDIIIYGESLGTGVTTRLAATVDVGGVILDSPFTSVVDRAAELYPFFPVRPFITDRYPVIDLIDEIDAPLLILHGARDSIIPVRMGKAVFAAAREPKTLQVFPQGGHSDLFNHGALDHILSFIQARP